MIQKRRFEYFSDFLDFLLATKTMVRTPIKSRYILRMLTASFIQKNDLRIQVVFKAILQSVRWFTTSLFAPLSSWYLWLVNTLFPFSFDIRTHRILYSSQPEWFSNDMNPNSLFEGRSPLLQKKNEKNAVMCYQAWFRVGLPHTPNGKDHSLVGKMG